MSYTEVEIWKVSDLLDALSNSPQKDKSIIIPQYQRNLVWSKKQKSLLIESIKEGLPIGSLLLYKENISDNMTYYHLVDGLQRSTAIRSYCSEPTKYFNESDLDENLLNKLENFFDLPSNKLSKIVITWIQDLTEFKESKGFSSMDLIDYISEVTNITLEKSKEKELRHEIVPFLEIIEKESNIHEISVPVLVYNGDKSNLPKIFERVNSKGTNLNKYQIYAATWSTYEPFNISSIKIINKIKEKYDSFINEGLEVDNYEVSTFNTSKFNYFEYFFGFGKLLTDEFPELFGKGNSKNDKTESIAFNLGAICLDVDPKDMGKLPKELIGKDLNKFETALLESIDLTNKILNPYLKFKGNKRGNTTVTIYHSEYQIVSIIGKIFKTIYDLNTFEKKDNYKNTLENLKSNIPFHYLLDILKGYWSGTGDTKALESSRSNRYELSIKKDQWENVLNEWYENDRSKKEKSRVTIKSDAKLLLNYIYLHKFTAYENLSDKYYDIEHLCPIDRLKKVATLVDGLPISCIGNLCILDGDINQTKKSKTYYEYYNNEVEIGELTQDQAAKSISKIEEYSFIKEKDLYFLSSLNEDNINLYYEFIDKRFLQLKKEFYKSSNIN
ncbi:DUF262 domain-containing protein [Turicibacter sanguinis]|uniref:DUF262 domain-containing protein n=1 Tax=Turicibacter sanguinis TaxID=154288 RepID=UPI00232E64DA|nr:DUF262 domain-containing protein [Turicibacter sanguinis]MDB8542713.1 DUF262 domain-containing protein [Turicibacter sanguinis]